MRLDDPDFPFNPRQWRKFEEMARRGFESIPGMGRRWRDANFFDHKFKISRALASGDVRLVALYFIEQQPRHGYDLIKAMEERSHGFYSPSPGVVYPALTYLEEAGFVTSSTEGNKKLYTITEEGRAHLAENRAAIESTLNFLGKAGETMRSWRDKMSEAFTHEEERRDDDHPGDEHRHEFRPGGRHGRGGFGPRDRDIPDVVPELNDARRDLKAAIADAIGEGEDTQRRVADILRKAASEIRGKAEDVVDL